jgi:hypothetical protein
VADGARGVRGDVAWGRAPLMDGITGYGRQEVVAYLRYLADRPEGVRHRAWLFHAAHLLTRDATVIFTWRRDFDGRDDAPVVESGYAHDAIDRNGYADRIMVFGEDLED